MHENTCLPAVTEKKLRLAIVVTAIILFVQIIGGILSNSLALISDSAHVFMDGFSLFLTLIALKISCRPTTDTSTYGYHRMEIFAALINGLSLTLISVGIIYKASLRFIYPQVMIPQTMLIFALFGLIGNIVSLFTLQHVSKEDLNIKGAFYHVLGDTLSSLGVILTGVIISFTGWQALDPITSFLISSFIGYKALKIIFDSLHLLLEGVPAHISLEAVTSSLIELEGVQDIHEIHIWAICSNILALSTHIRVNEQPISETGKILSKANEVLQEKFGISHVTIQFEYGPCLLNKPISGHKH